MSSISLLSSDGIKRVVHVSVVLQEGAVGSVGVSGLVCSADSDSSGESGACSSGWHLLQHTHTAPGPQYGGHTPPAQTGERVPPNTSETQGHPGRNSSTGSRHTPTGSGDYPLSAVSDWQDQYWISGYGKAAGCNFKSHIIWLKEWKWRWMSLKYCQL